MILYFSKILLSWFSASLFLAIAIRSVSTQVRRELYHKPDLLQSLFSYLNIPVSDAFMISAGTITHHLVGLLFVLVYNMLWYSEFMEISWMIAIAIGFFISFLRFLSWILLIQILPYEKLLHFKGHYLQVVFLYSLFTVLTVAVYIHFGELILEILNCSILYLSQVSFTEIVTNRSA